MPFVIVLLVAGGGAAYVALRGNPLHGNPLHGNLFRGNPVRADDRVPTADPTADPTAGEAPDPAPSAEPSVGESAPTGSAPAAAASASLSPTPSPTGRPNPGRTDLALHKKVKSLSDEQPGYPAAAAVDGDLTTRWSSGFSDPQWIRVDLAAVWSVTDIKLHWENAYAKAYRVDVSLDAKHWKTVYRTVTGHGGVRDIPLPPTPARFVRMYGTERNSQYGYSLLEFEVR